MPRRNPSSHQRRKPSAPALLVLQFDTEKLREDGLDLGNASTLAATVGQIVSGASAEIRATTDQRDLLGVLGALAQQSRRFDVIVAIGHSNEDGIRIASDQFVSWEVFATYLKPFEPRRLMIIACKAGQWPAATILFRKLPKLRRIFASPMNASKNLANFMLAMIPYLLEVKAPRDSIVRYGQMASIALTGRQVRQWIRDRDKDDPGGALLDLAAQWFDPLLREIPRSLQAIFK